MRDPPPTICATKKYTEGCPWHPQNYWAYCTAEMKTSVHNLNCFKQTSKQTIQPLVTLGGLECSPRERVPLLTWMDIACSDLLLVFAAGKLGAFEPLLYSHVAFLNPASTQFGAFRPGRPGAHPAAWKLFPVRLFPQLLTSPALSDLPPAQFLDGWISEALPDAALFPLHSLWAGRASKLRLHLDHAGSNHVAFPT